MEAALRADPEVADARVTGDGDRLVAYVIPAAGRPRWTGVRERLSRVLPAYLVPSAMVSVNAFPLTSSGKLNVRALPPPAEDVAAPDPHPGLETTIAEIFAGLLARPVNRDDDFFLSGGHSLAAVKAVARIQASVGVEVTTRTLFANPTVAALAAAIDAGRGSPGNAEIPDSSMSVPTPPGRLSGPQYGLWIIHQAGQDNGAYVVHAAVRLEGTLDEADLRARFAHTLAAHPVLRSAIVVHDDTPRLIAAPCADESAARAWRTTDLSAHADPWPEAERLAARDADHPFDLTRRPLVRAHLIRTAPTTHLLTITAHHIICDDTSMSILLTTLTTVDPTSSPLSGATDAQQPRRALSTRTGAPGLPVPGLVQPWVHGSEPPNSGLRHSVTPRMPPDPRRTIRTARRRPPRRTDRRPRSPAPARLTPAARALPPVPPTGSPSRPGSPTDSPPGAGASGPPPSPVSSPSSPSLPPPGTVVTTSSSAPRSAPARPTGTT